MGRGVLLRLPLHRTTLFLMGRATEDEAPVPPLHANVKRQISRRRDHSSCWIAVHATLTRHRSLFARGLCRPHPAAFAFFSFLSANCFGFRLSWPEYLVSLLAFISLAVVYLSLAFVCLPLAVVSGFPLPCIYCGIAAPLLCFRCAFAENFLVSRRSMRPHCRSGSSVVWNLPSPLLRLFCVF
jgi:hypothetical protein